MSAGRRLVEGFGRLSAILGVPGLVIGLISVVSLGFGAITLVREYNLLRDTGRRAIRPILAAWVRSTPVHYLGWTLPDYVDRLRQAPAGREAERRDAAIGALIRLAEELDRPSRRASVFRVVSLGLRGPDGMLANWGSVDSQS